MEWKYGKSTKRNRVKRSLMDNNCQLNVTQFVCVCVLRIHIAESEPKNVLNEKKTTTNKRRMCLIYQKRLAKNDSNAECALTCSFEFFRKFLSVQIFKDYTMCLVILNNSALMYICVSAQVNNIRGVELRQPENKRRRSSILVAQDARQMHDHEVTDVYFC